MIANQDWHFLENQFDNVTEGSKKLMNILISDHMSRLTGTSSDPIILPLKNRTQPVHDDYKQKYADWLSSKGAYRFSTEKMKQRLNELSNTKIKQWEAQVRVVYLENAPEYFAIFPNGRSPFQTGTIEDRISNVKALSISLTPYAPLNATRTDVTNFYNTILADRDVQQQKEEQLNVRSGFLEISRKAAAKMMYRNLGVLMDNFSDNKDFISSLWDLSLLRTKTSAASEDEPSEPIIGMVPASDTVNIINRKFYDTTQFVLKNTSSVQLRFGIVATANTMCTAGTVVPPGTEVTVSATALGNISDKFLNVTNADTSTGGSYEVVIVG